MGVVDYLIVGAGMYGATCARLLADAGRSVMVIERRPHIGGNCYDEQIAGCYVNLYGGHIFHTNSRRIWDFINRFGEWRHYEHRVKARVGNRVYSLPPNRATFDQLGLAPGADVERTVREMFFAGYTRKQWGMSWDELPESVRRRVPIRYTYDDRYFDDRYQAVPEYGYTKIFERWLADIPVELEVDYLADAEYWRSRARRVIYSGALDEFFGYDMGRLGYRSLAHDTRVLDTEDYQGCATVNYPEESVPYTRIMEWRHFGWRSASEGRTVITYEYPRSTGEPYYPIVTDDNLALYARYAARAEEISWLRIGGRLGSYRYYNMDQAIAAAFALVRREAAGG